MLGQIAVTSARMTSLLRDDSLLPLTEKWLRWKNTAKPSPRTLRARRVDLAVIAALIADSLGRSAGPSDSSFSERELSRLRIRTSPEMP